MIKKINKKILFRTSLIFSGILTLIASSRAESGTVSGLIDAIPPVNSLVKTEKAFAYGDSGDCCGSGCDGAYVYSFPTPTSSGVALWFSDRSQISRNTGRPAIPSCFIAGTKVSMADGSIKNIEEIVTGEELLSSDDSNTVLEVFVIPHKGDVYSLNGSSHYFFTAGHPFMTTNGWKSMNPEMSQLENPGLEVGQMQVGDILIKLDGQTEVVESIEEREEDTTVYNFKVSGDNSFYADGYLVHNAALKRFP